MRSIYDELVKLQRLPDAFKEWADYRAKLTDFILGETEEGASALIVGAGQCNDLDIRRLKEHFGRITLMDRDLGSVAEGLERQGVSLFGLEPGADISLECGDIVGIDEEMYRKLCLDALEAVRAGRSGADMEELFLDTMEQTYSCRKPYTFAGDYDCVICCGVHSQLNNMFCQIAEVYQHYVKFSMEKIFRRASMENAVIAHALNRQLAALACRGVIMALEKQRIGVEGAIEGAYQAIEDIELNYRINREQSIIWPFDGTHGKIYRMRVISINKN